MSGKEASRYSIAERIAARLHQVPGVMAICLFGSVARGDQGPLSDIDLLVAGTDSNLSPSKLLRVLPPSLRKQRLAILYYTMGELDQLFSAGLSFVQHLKQEGRILYDPSGRLRILMAAPVNTCSRPGSLDAELEAELENLQWFERPGMFNNNFLFVFSWLYTIGKSVVILRLLKEGVPEFNQVRAFETLRNRHPELGPQLERIEELRPFYAMSSGKDGLPLPFPFEGTARRVRPALKAIREVAA